MQLVLGTAGHIDHGKTAVVRALTGIDCDRLPEEKSRGITIDLGFAHWERDGFRFGIVDVPGHERFVRNMVAGATGIDLALLVVACDDSVMPQTREHLAILELLGIRAGLVALTKCDLVEEDHLALVREEVAELTQGTFLQAAPVVPVSVVTEQGLGDLARAVVDVARHYQVARRRHVFRLPIDRVFTLPGHGTIVTGTVRGGSVCVGDTVALLPPGSDVRVRRLQSHGADAERVLAGQRAAINLAGVKQDELARGSELAQPGYLALSRRLLVKIRVLPSEERPLVDRRLVRLHLAAREVTARVVLEERRLSPGETGYAVLVCQSPVVAEYGERFVLRRLSPVFTLGGGTVLAPAPGRTRTRQLLALGPRLDDPDPRVRIAAYLDERGEDDLSELTLAGRVGVEPCERESLLRELLAEGRIHRAPEGQAGFLHAAHKERLKDRILGRCRTELERRRPARAIPAAVILTALKRWTSRCAGDALLDELVAEGRLTRRGDRVGLPSDLPALSKRQQSALDAFVAACTEGGTTPPSLKDFAEHQTMSVKELEPLVQIAVDTGQLVRVSADLAVRPEALDRLRTSAVACVEQHGTITVAQLKECWQVSRKYAVPYLEFFDRLGITIREGDLRRAGPNAHRALEELIE